MNVFISYSTEDLNTVKHIASAIEPNATVRYWDKSKEPGAEAWPTIFKWIDESDVVITIITDKTVARAMSVGQEIGHAKAKNKTIIPLVSEGIPSSALGCLGGVTYELLTPANLSSVQKRLSAFFAAKKADEEAWKNVFILGAIFAFILFIVSKKE